MASNRVQDLNGSWFICPYPNASTGGLREGAIESLRISDYSPIYSDGKVIAGKIIAYNGEPERYTTFITPEALNALEKDLEFRRDHGEIPGAKSPHTP